MTTNGSHINRGIPYSIRKQLRKGWIAEISETTGFSISTVRKVSIGQRNNPSVRDAILTLFERQKAESQDVEKRVNTLLNK